MTRNTLNVLKTIWPEVREYLSDEYTKTMNAMRKADSVDTIRTLQGRANAQYSFLNLPEALEAVVSENEKDVV